MPDLPVSLYSHQTKTLRRYRGGRGYWSRAHVLPGPRRERIEGELVRFLCGHETDALTVPVSVETLLPPCRACLRAQVARKHRETPDA